MGDNKKNILMVLGLFLIAITLCIGISFTKKNIAAKNNSNESVKQKESESITDIIENTSSEISKGPGPTPEKIAYITIDDGPSKYTSDILDILSENDVKATFFMLNNNMNLHQDDVKRMVKEGHGVGFHSVSHDVKKLYKTPTSSVEEFDTCNKTLYDITGETSKLIRLPYGSKPYTPKENYDNLVKSDYLIWDWSLDTLDWKSSKDQIVSNVLYYGREKEEIILLMHEKEQSVNALNDTIKILKERGYTIMPITETIQPKNFWNGNTNN
ncbi:MAG: polysaccharide deacetylase family protein [Peptostreptococcaceae bacterium]